MIKTQFYTIKLEKNKPPQKPDNNDIKVIKPKRNILSIEDVPYKKLGVLRVFQSPKITNAKLSAKPFVEIEPDTFFVRMKHYQKDPIWAERMVELTYAVSSLISLNYDFDEILKYIEENIKRINGSEAYGKRKKAYHSGFTIRKEGRGEEYFETYRKYCSRNIKRKDMRYHHGSDKVFATKCSDPLINPYTCDIYYHRVDAKSAYIKVLYGDAQKDGYKTENLEYVKREYEKLKQTKNPTKKDINNAIAKIHWLIAQQSPYCRGNDSIANVLTKAIYHSYGYKVSPLKEGKSFDFEAFYRDLKDYVKIYPSLFEIEPYKDI